MEGKRWLSTREVAELFSVSEATIRRWANKGTLPMWRIKQKMMFDADQLVQVLEPGGPFFKAEDVEALRKRLVLIRLKK